MSQPALSPQVLSQSSLIGYWGFQFSPTRLEYLNAGYIARPILTDDGILRSGYPYERLRGIDLTNEPQEEWEFPLTLVQGFNFTPEGTFSFINDIKVANRTDGYQWSKVEAAGRYQFDGSTITLEATYSLTTIYSDRRDFFTAFAEPFPIAGLRVTTGESGEIRFIHLKRDSNGTIIPDPENPQGTAYQQEPGQPVDISRGALSRGTIRDDSLTGTPSNDIFGGLEGNDTLLGMAGNDALLGAAGNDTLNGGAGNDSLDGATGADLLQGGSGQDILQGGRGNNVLQGGGGRDIFILDRGPGVSRIVDFRDRRDRLGLNSDMRFSDLTIRQRGQNTLISHGNDPLALLVGVRANTINAADFVSI